ncbi:hypothetical protein QTP81_02725 [Alteromonas sp. ASW11-36]|uniref:Uncharacterized protein n=1 Tax=Alteromonas arenosi TaxID=3055817 RepID=A0ABT7SU35_9ALTE|nr:hypothetical protein [Alteromonas sp. ASW11-36]MDM7859519.1 hypothetical protein [Alteromonas sp. ASW11-36]
MKEFFWAVVAAYVFLYFYAAWLYDGFSVYLAVSLFIALVANIYWLKRRKDKHTKQVSETAESAPPIKVDTQPISLWRSPLPYMGILIIAVVLIVINL